MNIFDFKLYVFDLDGVIINSEKFHWEAYKKALSIYGKNSQFNEKNLTFKKYCEIKHSIEKKNTFKNIFTSNYDKFYEKKKKYYYSNIDKIKLMEGVDIFINNLLSKKKYICLVTDSSEETLKIFKKKFPILQKMHHIITRDHVDKRKPSSEGYLKVINKYNYINYSDIVGFEDSYKGIIAMSGVIYNTVLVNNSTYFYYDKIKPILNCEKIDNFNNISSYNIKNFNMSSNYIEYKNKINLLLSEIKNKNKKSSIIFDYVVISAAGKGSRLLPLTKNIPKILVTYNNNCLLNNIVYYWKYYTKKFVVIINKKYNSIVKFYLDLLNINYEIIFVELIHNYENSYTLNKALSKPRFLNKKILLTWCDIYPNQKLNINIFKDKNIIFTYKNFGRYEAYNNNLIKKDYGNVIGIYYFSNFTYLKKITPLMDLCDCYKKNFGNFETFEIPEIIDLGDMEKLIIYTNTNTKINKYVTRYFNKISEIDSNKLLKESTCEYGNKIIEKEIRFYKYHSDFKFKPKIYEFRNNSYLMEKIDNAKQVIIYFNESLQYVQFDILEKCLELLEKLHEKKKISIEKSILLRDINIEFKLKIENRLKKIKPLLTYFSFIKKVNNVVIKTDHNIIIQKLSNNIITFLKKNVNSYHTIHGDCNLSNILVDSNKIYYLIDPRGYFGESNIFGINYYDIGKILYSLSGFDELNNRNNHYFIINDDNIFVNINNNMDNYFSIFKKYNKSILIDMVIINWFGLAEYSKNNIHKCISAYYYAIFLYQKYYKDKS
jgi:beta-phosphoglucomutase-like phosphatase (HAD superfamily)